jgi:hypothetical protein
MDIHGAHKREDVLKHLKRNFGIDVLFIPGSLTSQVQPLNVLFNKSLARWMGKLV